MTELRVTEDPAGEVAELLVEAARAGHQIVLTGGSTPRDAYERAAGQDVDWHRATVWFGDERCVPADDERSNYAMAAAALLDRIPDDRAPAVMRMPGELGPQQGADVYEALLREQLGSRPCFDLLLLGLGDDGHMASLFPARPAVHERDRLVVGVPDAGLPPFVPRISLTLPVINDAQRVVFLVAGAGKAPAVSRAFGGQASTAVPASLVHDPLVILDAAAASELPR
jgi:6-phosphogluconolactonase